MKTSQIKMFCLAPFLSLALVASAAADDEVFLQLIFDASGSMAGNLGSESKIEAARRAIGYLIDALPEGNRQVHVGFRVFGHEGDNTDRGRSLSCRSSELKVPMDPVDAWKLHAEAAAYQPTGWTPITLALTQAGGDFAFESGARNVVILVTDGEETCFGDPCAAAQMLADSNAPVVAHVIGFGLEPAVAETLQCIARNTGGAYVDADDGDSLAGLMLGLVGAEVRQVGAQIQTASVPQTVTVPTVTINDDGVFVAGAVSVTERGINVADAVVVDQGGVVVAGDAVKVDDQGVNVGGDAVSVSGSGVRVGGDTVQVTENGINVADVVRIDNQGIEVAGMTIDVSAGGDPTAGGDPEQFGKDMEAMGEDLEAMGRDLEKMGEDLELALGGSRTAAVYGGEDILKISETPRGKVIHCARNGDCGCGDDAKCIFHCDGGNCDFACGANSECIFNCDGGNCDGSCDSGSRCIMTNCPFGSCDMECEVGARCRLND